MKGSMIKTHGPEKTIKYFKSKLAFTLDPEELRRALVHGDEVQIIDVRSAEEFFEGHIPGAINIPAERWHFHSRHGLSKKKPSVLYCSTAVSHLSARAAVYFAGKGYHVIELQGGMAAWKNYGFEIEKRSGLKSAEEQQDRKVA